MRRIIFAGLVCFYFSVPVSGEQTWVAFLPEYPEGTPPIVNVLVSDDDHAVIEVATPGM